MEEVRKIVGVYSGPGCDGVDVALVEVRGRGEELKAKCLSHLYSSYSSQLRKRLQAASQEDDPRHALEGACDEVMEVFIRGVLDLLDREKVGAGQIAAIGSAGQVGVDDRPIESPALLAQKTGIAVVSGFSDCDLAAGGNGAAVTAWPNWLLLRHKRWSRVIVHLGDLATLTFVGSDAHPHDTQCFDVGPGMAVIDAVVQEHFGQPFDEDGAIASRGQVNGALLNELQANRYYYQSPPKCCWPGQWAGTYAQRVELMARKRQCQREDLVATVTELTVRVIVQAIEKLTERPHDVVLSGGGARNIHLASRLRTLMCPSATVSTEKYHIPLRGHVPMCYAILAAARLDGVKAHCPVASGASRRVTLGTHVLP